MDSDHPSDDALTDAAIAGEIRCHNLETERMSLLRPLLPSVGSGLLHHQATLKLFGPVAQRFYYIQLLQRAEAFVEFFQGNVGVTADYPLRLQGESKEALDAFYEQLQELKDVVGVLVEI